MGALSFRLPHPEVLASSADPRPSGGRGSGDLAAKPSQPQEYRGLEAWRSGTEAAEDSGLEVREGGEGGAGRSGREGRSGRKVSGRDGC